MKLQLTLGLMALAAYSFAGVTELSETFADTVDGSGTSNISGLLSRGWVVDNASTSVGTTSWFGSDYSDNGEIAAPGGGSTTPFIAANYNATGSTGTIADYLETPELKLQNTDVLTFWTISDDGAPDALKVLMSTSGASTATSAFSTTLLSINPTLTGSGYPDVWTEYTVTVSGIPSGAPMGRLAFEYAVPNGGALGVNSSFVGVANVNLVTPEPAPVAALGLGVLFLVRRRRSSK